MRNSKTVFEEKQDQNIGIPASVLFFLLTSQSAMCQPFEASMKPKVASVELFNLLLFCPFPSFFSFLKYAFILFINHYSSDSSSYQKQYKVKTVNT